MKFLLSLFFIGFFLLSFSQSDTVVMSNPSFEDIPRKGSQTKGINGWYDCGLILFPAESPPDIHPMDFWGVNTEPYEGETYLGLVVRDNETWESVSQRVSSRSGVRKPMLAGICYKLSMAVARSDKYMSGSRFANKMKRDKSQTYNYYIPVVVRVWAGDGYCDKKELLAVTEPVDNSEWETIELDFTLIEDSKSITIEAFYKLPLRIPYNGHVLIDNLSDIIQIDCKG